MLFLCFFFFKQNTAYEITRRDWSSDVCSSDLRGAGRGARQHHQGAGEADADARGRPGGGKEIGRASCRKECALLCRSRWSPYHEKKKKKSISSESTQGSSKEIRQMRKYVE